MADSSVTDLDYRTGYYKDFFGLPSQTNYVTETFFTPNYSDPASPVLDVLGSSDLLRRTYGKRRASQTN